MLSWFASYPYLVTTLVLLACFTFLFALPKAPRQTMLVSGLLSTFSAVYALAFVPHYWNPNRVLAIAVGVEDVLFSFANGGITWYLATAGTTPDLRLDARRVTLRFLRCAAIVAVVTSCAWLAGLSIMTCVILSAGAIFFLLVRRHRDLLSGAMRSAGGFTLLWTSVAWGALAFQPAFASQWNPEGIIGLRLFHLPIEEIYWAGVYGLTWPLAMAHVFGHEEHVQAGAMQLNSAQ